MENDFEERLAKIEGQLSELFQTISDAEAAHNRKVDVEGFKERNGEKLGKYESLMKKFNGDDFDLYGAAYDEYSNEFSDVDEDTYIAKLIEMIDSKISAVKEAVEADAPAEEIAAKAEEAKEAVEETKEAMEEHGEEHVEEGEKEAETGEEIKEESKSEGESDEEKAEESEDEGIDEAEFQAQLDEDYEKYHR